MNTNWEQFTYDVVDGKANGKILFQPRILCWYTDKVFAGESLGEFEGMSLSDIYKTLDVSNRIYDYGASIQRVVDKKSNNRWCRFPRRSGNFVCKRRLAI